METSQTGGTLSASPAKHLPGEEGIWFFIFADMVVFGVFFVTFVVYRADNLALYLQSHSLMNQGFGVANTLLLLTSSWFVALGVRSVRLAHHSRAGYFITLAILCGVAFEVNKFFEWGEKIRHGITFQTNEFFQFYFMLTGIHFVHVLIGIGVLLFVVRKEASLPDVTQARMTAIENGASFWHLVDILWIVLFALFYLMK